jgi:signal transduction histidine kinase
MRRAADADPERQNSATSVAEINTEARYDTGREAKSDDVRAGTNTDITEQRAAEEALREADRHRTEFLAWLSHELRNPLGIIHTSLALIERAGLKSAPGRRAVSVIGRQAAQMNRLVDDLLDITRILEGKSPSQTHNRHVERDRPRDGGRLSAAVHPRGHQSGRPDHQATPGRLRGTARIEQIVGNLLQNALKFTAMGGRVVLSVRAGKNHHGIIAVRDDGAGLSAGLIAHIFEPLVQDTRTIARSRGGLGLGLPLVKRLVELHGGTVSASSDGPGGGAVFTVRLPLDRRQSTRR